MSLFSTLFQSARNRTLLAVAIAIILSVVYGVALRIQFAEDVMTGGFLILMPISIGFLTVWASPEHLRKRWLYAIFAPWWAILLFVVVVLIVSLEGLICALIIAPIFGIMSSCGGVMARLVSARRTEHSGNSPTLILAAVLVVPIVAMPLEERFPLENRIIKTVRSEIRIHAPKEVVWQHIIRVRAIAPEEQTPSFFHNIGFPKPIEATLSFEGVGGVRHASFERGVVFTETITDWQSMKKIRFSIRANTESIPPTTFDEHVTIGGQYFDILTGTYELAEERENQETYTRLYLYSEQRLSTNINVYAGLWTGAIMQDIQSNILNVIKRRCEAASMDKQ